VSEPLGDVQRWMLDALVHPGGAARGEIDRHVLPGPRLGAAAHLAIYQRSYILRLTGCLAEQFPALCHALGEDLFHDFARDYLRARPSESYTLHDLGRRFPAWLEASRPDADRSDAEREGWIDFMVDLARYERELFRLFDAPGHEGEPWPGVETPDEALVLQPCFALGEYRYPVAWYYHEVRARRDPAFPQARESHVAIARRDYVTSTFPIRPLHFQFLSALERDGSVPAALAAVAASAQRPLAEVTRSWVTVVRRAWIEAGFFVARGDGRP
jgi:hypothetical protein